MLVSIAPFAIEEMVTLGRIAPGYENPSLGSLAPPKVDEFVRPIFEASGLADDFIPWREAFPDYEEGADDDA